MHVTSFSSTSRFNEVWKKFRATTFLIQISRLLNSKSFCSYTAKVKIFFLCLFLNFLKKSSHLPKNFLYSKFLMLLNFV